MKNLDEETILKTLSFILENNNRISRYTLDKFITKSFLFDKSFNVIPTYLFENQLITIEDNQTFISLTEKGKNLTNYF